MKKILIATTLCMGALSLPAQYKIDLSAIKAPRIEYLKMGHPGPKGKEIRVNNLYLEEGGQPRLPVMGEFHYSRMDARYWRDALLKMKASGIDIVATYCLWSLHEEVEGELSWKDHLDLRRFVQLCDELGMKVHLRIGPYCNAEILHGALPSWLIGNKNLTTRSNDPLYLSYVERWYQAVYSQVKGLLYKDGGPIMAVQLENEYVRPGMVVPHLLKLKEMAVRIGFDVPLYSMTHWMSSDYPKGEIIPYAGYYIETPWTTSGKNEIPTSDFEYFTYNRISNNIGTDIIKTEGQVVSLSGENNDSPYFTCEVGVGSTSFYGRRAVIPQEMAGENINLRLGCGVNLMGYYMYVGGSNPVGKITTLQSSGPRVNYDYQAPVREFGQLGAVMPETKKYNFFMNDFGSQLAPAVAYLPTTNQNINNLQWAVRSDGGSGYLFCSNYLYKHTKRDYRNVQFQVKLAGETLRMPRKKVTVKDGTYFFWPFNQRMDGVLLKYATAQPVCQLKEGNSRTLFFFEDDQIPAEYLMDAEGVRNVTVQGGHCRQEKGAYFIDGLQPGKQCAILIEKTDGTTVRIVTLTEAESDQLWKGTFRGKEFVALSSDALVCDNDRMTLISESPAAELWMFDKGTFVSRSFEEKVTDVPVASFRPLSPLGKAAWIAPASGNTVKRTFRLLTLSTIEKAFLRYTGTATASVNDKKVTTKSLNGYQLADITSLLTVKGKNLLQLSLLKANEGIAAEVEIMLRNGERITWSTDGTWTADDGRQPVRLLSGKALPAAFDAEEHLAVYEVNAPAAQPGDCETRMYISYEGDVANAYLNGQLTGDSFYDGTPWILSLSRLPENIEVHPMVIRINGLKSADAPIYFEQNVRPENCVVPSIRHIDVNREHRFKVE